MPGQEPLALDSFNALARCRHGMMLYNRNDRYVGASLRKYGEFSPGESEVFRKLIQPGTWVVEGGANIGAHTLELARLAGAVFAFEPQRLVFQTLCANLALNGILNVQAYQMALGETETVIGVPVLDPRHPENFGGLSLLGATGGEAVPQRRLDDLGLPGCDFLKLDVEGMEVEALRGGAGLIARHRPALYVENDRRDRSAELTGLLLRWEYRLYDHRPPLFAKENFNGDSEDLFPGIVSLNLLGLPRERGVTVNGLREVTAPG